jgi:hypothetical protein
MLYRELSGRGGQNGGSLSAGTISRVHRTLREALADAVDVDQVLAVNPAARSKRPKTSEAEPGQIWTTGQLNCFLTATRLRAVYGCLRRLPARYVLMRQQKPLGDDVPAGRYQ